MVCELHLNKAVIKKKVDIFINPKISTVFLPLHYPNGKRPPLTAAVHILIVLRL